MLIQNCISCLKNKKIESFCNSSIIVSTEAQFSRENSRLILKQTQFTKLRMKVNLIQLN